MTTKVVFHVVIKKIKDGILARCVKAIKKVNEEMLYVFPENCQPESFHPTLFEKPIVKNAAKSIKKLGQYRNIILTLDDALLAEYMDEEGNFRYNDFYLEEYALLPTLPETKPETRPDVKPNDDILEQVEKAFSIDKFDGNMKATDWWNDFEAECERFGVTSKEQKVKCLRLFVRSTAEEWFKASAVKLQNEDWSSWRDSFLKVFGDKGWSKVRYVYDFKYVSGSLLHYAVKKERLLLELERQMTEFSRINSIVLGLPYNIQDKIDREEIKCTDDLMNAVRRYDDNIQRKETVKLNFKPAQKFIERRISETDKRPCHICNSLGYPGRYHPVESCWNHKNSSRVPRANLGEARSFEDDVSKLEIDSGN